MSTSSRILLVEDDAADAEYLCEILAEHKNFSAEIERVSCLKEAQDIIVAQNFDAILADLSLPDSQGLETFTSLLKGAETLPIVVLTGLDDENTALETLRLGAQDYLVKGQFNATALVKTIQYAIERNKIRTELAAATQQLSQANERLDQMAHNDSLTSLLNRRGLEQVILRELAWAHRHGSSTMALIIDLDDFKKINDTIGHSAGDAVLKEMAIRMQDPLRSTDFAARIGGDEFLILLPDTEAAEGVRIAEKVRQSIAEKPFIINSQDVKVTVSVGVVPIVSPSLSIDQLLLETHDALYQSKRGGKNKVSFEEQRKDRSRPDRNPDMAELLKSKARFHSVVQPIYNMLTNEPVGYEFFSRSSLASLEKPEEFFRMGWENEIQGDIDRRCLAASLQAARNVSPGLRRHINISPVTLLETDPAKLVETYFSEKSGGSYCLEISQKQIVGDPSYLAGIFDSLKKAGIRIAIENMGFSQSALESLVLLKPDYLKIDKQFVAGLSHDPARLRSIKRLVKIADGLSIEVIASGIESKEDFDALKQAGIKFGQGFYWSQPRHPSEKFTPFN